MRKSSKPSNISPELVNIGDLIEVRWETAGVEHSTLATVGERRTNRDQSIAIIAANQKDVLCRYVPGRTTLYPVRGAEIWRHRIGAVPEGLFNV